MNDFILLMVIFSSMIAGILLPCVGSIFPPYPVYLMMFLLFLSFLSIKIDTILYTVRNHTQTVIWLVFLKLIALPLTVYFLFKVFYPSYAIAALVLTGISMGVFSTYSDFFFQNPSIIFEATLVAIALGGIRIYYRLRKTDV
jgi:BASS family bile acid:Na+ symporter